MDDLIDSKEHINFPSKQELSRLFSTRLTRLAVPVLRTGCLLPAHPVAGFLYTRRSLFGCRHRTVTSLVHPIHNSTPPTHSPLPNHFLFPYSVLFFLEYLSPPERSFCLILESKLHKSRNFGHCCCLQPLQRCLAHGRYSVCICFECKAVESFISR